VFSIEECSTDRGYVKRLKLVNWRSFSECVMDLSPGLNTLVGPNDAGKSTILEAINLAIGDVYHSSYVPPTTDFHLASCDSFEISLDISVPNTLPGWFYEKYFIQSDQHIRGNVVGVMRIVGHRDSKGLEVAFKDRMGNWQEQSTYFLKKDVDFMYARSVRDISRHTATSFRSPLSEIRQILSKKLTTDCKQRVLVRLREADHELMQDGAFVELQAIIKDIVKDQTSLKEVKFSLTHPTPSELLRHLSIVGLDTFESALETKGVGTQNSVILALFQTLAAMCEEINIFALEEPEIGFHPHGQRLLMRRFQRLAAGGSQVFVTTHSPNLVDSDSLPNLWRVAKEELASKCYKMPTRPDLLETLDKHLAGDTTEMVFASKVLVVEGPSEVGYYPAISRKLEKDFDRHNISVVAAEGLSKVAKLVKIAKELNIPCHYVVDKSKDVKTQLFQNLLRERLITQEEFNNLPERPSNEWIQANESFLLRLRCMPTEDKAFEDMVLNNSDLFPRVLSAVNKVRKDWGEQPLAEDILTQRDPNAQREFLMSELKHHKGRRMGYELAQIYSESSEISPFARRVVETLISA